MVADIMTRKPSNTDNIFDFADSFASALTGSTMIRPIHTMIPIATILVKIWTLFTIVAVILRKSDHDFFTSRLMSASDCMPVAGLQFLKSCLMSPH